MEGYILEGKLMIVFIMVVSLKKCCCNSVGRIIVMYVVQSFFLIW
jgi:hypothetical protein